MKNSINSTKRKSIKILMCIIISASLFLCQQTIPGADNVHNKEKYRIINPYETIDLGCI